MLMHLHQTRSMASEADFQFILETVFRIIRFASHIAFALHISLDDDRGIDSFDLCDNDIDGFDLDNGNGIASVLIPSERPRLGSRLSSSIDDSHLLAVFGLIDEHDINVVTNDGLGSPLLSSADDLFDDDNGITPVSIPSEPSRLGSRFPAASDISSMTTMESSLSPFLASLLVSALGSQQLLLTIASRKMLESLLSRFQAGLLASALVFR
jgi:hypothetical protein